MFKTILKHFRERKMIEKGRRNKIKWIESEIKVNINVVKLGGVKEFDI